MNNIISGIRLWKTYSNGTSILEVLKDVNLEVREGEIVAITGVSGAGKSTLLHLLGGLDRPSSGQVLWEGVDIYSLGERERARLRNEKMGFIFQFFNLLPEFKAWENVLLPSLIKGEGKKREKEVFQILKEVGLENREEHFPSQLSGGEQQRVAIARALINQPRIIFADEPTGNLDEKNTRAILDLLCQLNRKRNQSLVIATHEIDIAERAHRVYRLVEGRIERVENASQRK